jgi:hypothetical protein
VHTGYLIVGIILIVFGVLLFLTVVLWPVGIALIAMAVILFVLAVRPAPVTAVLPVTVPSYPDQWHFPGGQAPPPSLSAPIPVVVNVKPSPYPFGFSGSVGSPPPQTMTCRRCGAPQSFGQKFCSQCGASL